MIKKILFSTIVIGSIALQNCSTSTPEPTPPLTAPSIIMPSVSGVDGVFISMNTRTKESGVEIYTGTGQAMFFKNQSPLTKVDGGSFKLNTKTVLKSDDNTYFYIPTTTDPKGVVFGTQIYWQGTGNTTNGVPVINDNDGGGFANVPTLGEFVNLSATQDYTLNWISSNGADSVIVLIKGPSLTYKKIVGPSISSLVIPKAEIAKLGTGGGSVTIINLKSRIRPIGTKTYAFIKEAIAFTNKVNIAP